MKNVLVAGVNGFVGKHLARELHDRGHIVYGVGNAEAAPSSGNKETVSHYYRCDITDKNAIKSLPLEEVDSVINLAGLANVGASFDNPELYEKTNVAVLNVLGEDLFRRSPKARMIAVSTGAVYDPAQSMPLNESSLVITNGSPYALSKLKMEEAGKALAAKGQSCIIVRPFNHIGPGQLPGFLVPDLHQKLLNYKKVGEPITVGNLETVRDYTDVRDIVRAYVDLVEADTLSDRLFNACSGVGFSGEEILAQLCEAMNINRDQLALQTDQSLIRPADPQRIIGDHSRITDQTGWEPQIPLEKTIKDFVEQFTT